MLENPTRIMNPLLIVILVLVGCGDDDAEPGDAAVGGGTTEDGGPTDSAMPANVEPDYADSMYWMCNGSEGDLCTNADLTHTVVAADGSFEEDVHAPSPDPDFDCFYLYPTVDLRFMPANTTDLSDIAPILVPLHAQGAWFRSVCRVFAPLYRQMAIGTYAGNPDYEKTDNFAMAYGDVTAAFEHYMERDNDGRKFVLVGHSQGTHMLTRLLEDRFDDDEAMREQLISAILIGPTGRVQVPEGEVVGGTFDNIPLCQAEDETGCVITYDSEAAALEATRLDAVAFPDGLTRACTNPAALAGGSGTFAETIWSTLTGMPFPDEVDTAWASYPDFHTGTCGDNSALVIDSVADDPRVSPGTPQQLQTAMEMQGSFALHLGDFSYALGDLLRIAAAQGAAAGN